MNIAAKLCVILAFLVAFPFSGISIAQASPDQKVKWHSERVEREIAKTYSKKYSIPGCVVYVRRDHLGATIKSTEQVQGLEIVKTIEIKKNGPDGIQVDQGISSVASYTSNIKGRGILSKDCLEAIQFLPPKVKSLFFGKV